MVSESDWSSNQETLCLLSVPGMGESMSKGLKTPVEKMFKGPSLVISKIVYTKQAQKDAKKISASELRSHTERVIRILEENPSQNRRLLSNCSVIWKALIPDALLYNIGLSMKFLMK